MAKELQSSVQVAISGVLTNALDLSTPEDSLSKSFRDSLATGTVLDQADRMWHDNRTLSATSEDIDLAGGVTDGLGASVTFVKVKCIAIFNNSTTAGDNLTVGGAAATQFVNWVGDATDKIVIGPGGCFLLWNPSLAGYAVGAGASDLLKVDSGANEIEYDIIIIGTSA